ncbi:unnamed protein product [Prorocentrum cordatum]|uniref:Carrier domain-containing protein n=1 Tax=Prorocentrum cordatum TaxID=2364126 RepID=A0ABN9QT22_9DINO|nr:unnamed protein product [Polarella glacialis]
MLLFAHLGWVIRRLEVTHLTCTPSLWSSFEGAHSEHPDIAGLRGLCLGGERMGANLLEAWAAADRLRFMNTYGTTECTVWQTVHVMRPGDSASRVGQCLGGNAMRIVDTEGEFRELEPGREGEILQGGVQVGLGYFRRPDKSAAAFLEDPAPSLKGRWYRTGDAGSWSPERGLEVHGRFDSQVKIRGMRIELGDVEAAVLKAGTPRLCGACCVLLREGSELHAFVQLEAETAAALLGEVDVGEHTFVTELLLQGCAKLLPRHMLPTHFLLMSRLPLGRTGKLDRKGLPAASAAVRLDRANDRDSLTKLERVVAGVWGEVLGVDGGTLGPQDHFLALGGNSVSVLRASRALAARARARGADLAPDGQAAFALAPERLIHSPRLQQYCHVLERSGVAGLLLEEEEGTPAGEPADPGPLRASPQAASAEEDEAAAASGLRINYTKLLVTERRALGQAPGAPEDADARRELDHEAWEQAPRAEPEQLLFRAAAAGIPGAVAMLLETHGLWRPSSPPAPHWVLGAQARGGTSGAPARTPARRGGSEVQLRGSGGPWLRSLPRASGRASGLEAHLLAAGAAGTPDPRGPHAAGSPIKARFYPGGVEEWRVLPSMRECAATVRVFRRREAEGVASPLVLLVGGDAVLNRGLEPLEEAVLGRLHAMGITAVVAGLCGVGDDHWRGGLWEFAPLLLGRTHVGLHAGEILSLVAWAAASAGVGGRVVLVAHGGAVAAALHAAVRLASDVSAGAAPPLAGLALVQGLCDFAGVVRSTPTPKRHTLPWQMQMHGVLEEYDLPDLLASLAGPRGPRALVLEPQDALGRPLARRAAGRAYELARRTFAAARRPLRVVAGPQSVGAVKDALAAFVSSIASERYEKKYAEAGHPSSALAAPLAASRLADVPAQASGTAPNPFDIPLKVKVVIVLVDPKKVALGQRYVAEARRVAPKVRINCVLEATRSKDPAGVDLFRRALLASGATQVSLGPWFTWLAENGVVASMAKDSSVEVVTDFRRNVCNVACPSFKESTEGSDVCYSLAIQPA